MVAEIEAKILMGTVFSIKATTVALLISIFLPLNLLAQLTDFEGIDFEKADSVAALYPKHPISNLKSLADKLTQPFSTEVEKFRAIYKWVSDNIENDYGLYYRNKSKRQKLTDRPDEFKEWNAQFSRYVFKKLLNTHKTVCTGYAYLIKELAYHANLNSLIINGYGRTTQSNIGGEGIANHSWNVIQLNGKWYLCDATWSSGAIDTENGNFIKSYNDAYFLPAPELFIRNHYPLDLKWMLLSDKPTLHEFLNGPLVYKQALLLDVLPLYPQTFDVEVDKGEILNFQFTNGGDDTNLEAFRIQVVTGGEITSFYPTVDQVSGKRYGFSHIFNVKGNYVIHALADGDYIFTYRVKVLH